MRVDGKNKVMPAFTVTTSSTRYDAVVERGVLARVSSFLPAKLSRLFVVTTRDVWRHHGARLQAGLRDHSFEVLYFTGGEHRKRLAELEELAEQMVRLGADRASCLIGFGGGIVTDITGFLAAVFLRGIPVLQIPTTLLAQVDAGVGGKTGVNLRGGKNLLGAFHQPLAVLADPDVLATLPTREFRAGLYEVIKCGVIRDAALFADLATKALDVLAAKPAALDSAIAASVRIKCEVVTADEKEADLRRILNFGHTIGHALEAETGYQEFLHGEAIAFGMKAATHLAVSEKSLGAADGDRIIACIDAYGAIPPTRHIAAEALLARLGSDKKTLHGKVHFVLPTKIGETKIVNGIAREAIAAAIHAAHA
jgi:3-dehydroquinate synthase